MTPEVFTAALEGQLRLRGAPFGRGEVLVFVAAAWPAAEEGPAGGSGVRRSRGLMLMIRLHRWIRKPRVSAWVLPWWGIVMLAEGLAKPALAQEEVSFR